MSVPQDRTQQSYWAGVLANLQVPGAMWIDGEWTEAAAGATTSVIAPRDNEVITEVPAAAEVDVDRAVAGALRAFEQGDWASCEPRERGHALLRWADLLERHRGELSVLVALEMGKPVTVAYSVEMRTAINTIRFYGEMVDKLMDEAPRGRPNAMALVAREPVGVVGAVVPWNFPMTLSMFKVPAALAAGNSVVVKPATQTPLSILRAAELASQAGIPAGVFQVVTGAGHVTGTALARHNDVATLTFTGSTEVGKQLLAYSAESNAKPVWLELGGKSPFVLFPDAPDMEKAIDTATWAITFNSGQMCTAASRLIVHESIHDDVVKGISARMDQLAIGDPLDPATNYGPLAGTRHRDDVLREIRAGAESGASLAYGSADHDPSDGNIVRPAIFTNVDPDSRLAQHEVFGPVLSVMSFSEEDEAVRLANHTEFGLGSAIWTSDLARAHRLSRRIDAGMVWVNCYEEGDSSVPFGGRKMSGHGADRGIHGLEKFTQLKMTWIEL